jgi:hypothetical protein
MAINLAFWRGAAWNLVVLAAAGIGTALIGVDPAILMMG